MRIPACLAMAGAAWLLGAMAASAAGISLEWAGLDSSATSTGPVYGVAGTVGPVDIGPMAGGAYAMDAGHVGGASGTPFLSISLIRGQVCVTWTRPATGWFLEEAGSLLGDPVAWNDLPSSLYQTHATAVSALLPEPSGAGRFYRVACPLP